MSNPYTHTLRKYKYIRVSMNQDNEKINEQIAKYIMCWEDASLNNTNIPLPDYMGDRDIAAGVIERLLGSF